MPNRTVVRRSTSRISSAVSAFIEDALPFPLRAALKKTKDLFDVNARIHRVRKTAHEYHPAQGQGSVFPQNSKNAVLRPTPSLGSSQHPAAAHVYHLPGYVFGFLGCEKRDSCRHIIHRRRPAN